MSAGNEEVVRRLSDHWERGEFSADAELYHPDVEFEMRMGVEHDRATGREAMGEAWHSQLAQWSNWRTGGVEDLRSAGNRVLLETEIRGRGRHSEVEVARPAFAVFTLEGGVVTRLDLIDNREDAFAAAGIEP